MMQECKNERNPAMAYGLYTGLRTARSVGNTVDIQYRTEHIDVLRLFNNELNLMPHPIPPTMPTA